MKEPRNHTSWVSEAFGNCLFRSVRVWRFLENHPFLTLRGMKEHVDETRVLTGLCAPLSLVCLLTLGGVLLPFFWADFNLYIGTCSRFQLVTVLLTSHRNNPPPQPCILPGQRLLYQTPVLAAFLYPSGETQGRTGHPETQKGLGCSDWV